MQKSKTAPFESVGCTLESFSVHKVSDFEANKFENSETSGVFFESGRILYTSYLQRLKEDLKYASNEGNPGKAFLDELLTEKELLRDVSKKKAAHLWHKIVFDTFTQVFWCQPRNFSSMKRASLSLKMTCLVWTS
jgi:hypothetical protein